jgi:hypothetical protein
MNALRRWLMVCIHNQPPPNVTLLPGVLVVVSRGQRLFLVRGDFATASDATKNS